MGENLLSWARRNHPPEPGQAVDVLPRTHVTPVDQADFADLYRAHVADVYRYLLVRTGHDQDAQDLTAQTFLTALERLPSYRGEGEFAAWLIGIARRKVVDHYRKNRPRADLSDITQLPHPAPLPEEVVEQRLQLDRVVIALRALAPDRAEAVAMHVFGHLTYAEIGQAMQRSADAAKMLVHRGLKDLRERLVSLEDK